MKEETIIGLVTQYALFYRSKDEMLKALEKVKNDSMKTGLKVARILLV